MIYTEEVNEERIINVEAFSRKYFFPSLSSVGRKTKNSWKMKICDVRKLDVVFRDLRKKHDALYAQFCLPVWEEALTLIKKQKEEWADHVCSYVDTDNDGHEECRICRRRLSKE